MIRPQTELPPKRPTSLPNHLIYVWRYTLQDLPCSSCAARNICGMRERERGQKYITHATNIACRLRQEINQNFVTPACIYMTVPFPARCPKKHPNLPSLLREREVQKERKKSEVERKKERDSERDMPLHMRRTFCRLVGTSGCACAPMHAFGLTKSFRHWS